MSRIRKWSQNDFLISAVFLLLIAILTFLPLANQLGFYRDDWHVTYAGTVHGPMKIFDEHKIDRPFMGLTYAATYAVLGNSPLAWQLYAFVIKVATALSGLWLARLLWPRQCVPAAMMALLLLVYPGFLQQPAAHSHQNFMLSFGLMVFSIALSVRALQAKTITARLFWIAFAAGTGFTGYMITEYMIGMEAVRGLILGYLIWRDGYRINLRQGFRLIKIWLPYLAAAGVFLFWRVVIFRSGRPATDVTALSSRYLENPLGMLLRLAIETGRDLIDTIFLAWAVPLYNLASTAAYSDVLISVALALAAVALLLLFLRRQPLPETETEGPDGYNWRLHAIVLGTGSALLALLPIILANRSVTFADTFDRYTQPSSLGVALFVTGAVYSLFTPQARRLMLGLLLAIGVLTHYHNAANFRNFWDYQKELWYQLAWRAPGIKAGTTLVPLLPPGYRLAEGYETWGPANLIFAPNSDQILIAGETLNRETVLDVAAGISYPRDFRRLQYKVDFASSLIVSLPSASSCLHVYDGQNIEFSAFEDPLIRLIAGQSRIDLIDVEGPGYTPPPLIFGRELEHDWCYYYQKASLARQQGDWETVLTLDKEAARLGLSPTDVSEWMPFYEARFRSGNMLEANQIASLLRANSAFIQPYCLTYSAAAPNQADDIQGQIVSNLCE